MSTWSTGQLVELTMGERRAAAASRRAFLLARRDRMRPVVSIRQQISVWCGYRMINLGSRLMRPVLLRSIEV